MKNIKKEIKQNSLIHQRIRKASFVPLEDNKIDKFKYAFLFKSKKYINSSYFKLKTNCNKLIQKPQLWLHEIDFITIKTDLTSWVIEALIEGFVINFIAWSLIGMEFNLLTMLGWGFAIKQLLSIYKRLRNNGSNSKIPKKDK